MLRTSLLDYFSKTISTKVKEIAVEHNGESISFEELNKKAICVCNYLIKEIKVNTNEPIAVFLPKEINTVISDIGIMYTHNAFMNLDIKMPLDRIGNIIKLVRPCVIISSSKHCEKLKDLDATIVNIDEIPNDFDTSSAEERKQIGIDTDPMCIINTSGSTGTPKGVVLNHRSFFDFIEWANETFTFDGTEVMGSLSPVVFDIFDFELCMLMVNGSKLVVLDSGLASFPARLVEKLQKERINFIFWVPSIMVNIANMDLIRKLNGLPDMRMVWFAGEVFPTKQFVYWYDSIPHATFVNLYGPIEITLDCTYHVIKERPNEEEPLPIGVACRNTDVLILNENNERCAEGEEGELCVRGTSLAMGYYNNPEKTAAAFTQNPLNNSYPELIYRTGDIAVLTKDGIIQFKGRKDSLIKHMGYRIELGEIEHVIVNDLKIVKYCCATYNYSAKEIVLFYENDEEIPALEFRKLLSKSFPSYMIPSRYERMDLLPRNTNGKIDRLYLKKMINED